MTPDERDDLLSPNRVRCIAGVEQLLPCADPAQLAQHRTGTWQAAPPEPRQLNLPRIVNPSGMPLRPTLPDFFAGSAGSGPFPSEIPGHAIHLSKVSGAVCIEGGIIVMESGDIFSESFRHGRHASRFTRRGITPIGGDRLVLSQAPPRPETITQPCFFLDGEHFPHFGHTLLEIFSRLWATDHLDLRQFTILTGKNVPGYVYELLSAIGVPRENVVRNPGAVLCSELWVASQSFLIRQSTSSLAHRCFSRLTGAFPATDSLPTRIYVSRSRVAERRLLNEGEVEALFRQHGFTILHPQEMSLGSQIAGFAAATHVAGCSGSNLFNCIFSGIPGHRFILSSTGYVLHTDVIVNVRSGSDVVYFFGTPEKHSEVHSPWRVNLDILASEIAAWLPR